MANSELILKNVRLTISYEKEHLVLSIWNKGSSFSNEAPTQSGKLFYRGSKERKSNSHFGIGLAFVKRVAELHSGNLTLDNANGGAVVTLTLKVCFSLGTSFCVEKNRTLSANISQG